MAYISLKHKTKSKHLKNMQIIHREIQKAIKLHTKCQEWHPLKCVYFNRLNIRLTLIYFFRNTTMYILFIPVWGRNNTERRRENEIKGERKYFIFFYMYEIICIY